MYLNQLTTNQKNLFMDIAYILASIDNDFNEEEKAIFEMYCQEMKIDFAIPEKEIELEGAINKINEETNISEKKIFIFELVGLAITDGIYNDKEKEIISMMISKFDLPIGFSLQCENIIEEYLDFQKRINQLIL